MTVERVHHSLCFDERPNCQGMSHQTCNSDLTSQSTDCTPSSHPCHSPHIPQRMSKISRPYNRPRKPSQLHSSLPAEHKPVSHCECCCSCDMCHQPTRASLRAIQDQIERRACRRESAPGKAFRRLHRGKSSVRDCNHSPRRHTCPR